MVRGPDVSPPDPVTEPLILVAVSLECSHLFNAIRVPSENQGVLVSGRLLKWAVFLEMGDSGREGQRRRNT